MSSIRRPSIPPEPAIPDDLRQIAVIGGGRWARVYLETLHAMLPPSVLLTAHAPHSAPALQAWASARSMDARLRVESMLPEFAADASAAAIVVNAARDHEAATSHCLARGVRVLLEKPMTTSASASHRLVDMARQLNVDLAAAHVFRFASYVDHFARRIAETGKARSIRIEWTDPAAEDRYGETKRFDASLPMFADCLPHVVSLLVAITKQQPDTARLIKWGRGGAAQQLLLSVGDVGCDVVFERNADRRRRTIDVVTDGGSLALDFSVEPGRIRAGDHECSGDAEWEQRRRPLAQLLLSFLGNSAREPRLSVEPALCAAELTDQLMVTYRHELGEWLQRQADASPSDVDLSYARAEQAAWTRT